MYSIAHCQVVRVRDYWRPRAICSCPEWDQEWGLIDPIAVAVHRTGFAGVGLFVGGEFGFVASRRDCSKAVRADGVDRTIPIGAMRISFVFDAHKGTRGYHIFRVDGLLERVWSILTITMQGRWGGWVGVSLES
jgi:hypothetical protein